MNYELLYSLDTDILFGICQLSLTEIKGPASNILKDASLNMIHIQYPILYYYH